MTMRPKDLLGREQTKHRQSYQGLGSMTAGLFLAPLTGGTSLFASAMGVRRIYIAEEKEKLIRAEIARRNLLHCQLSNSDAVLPFLLGCCVGGIGMTFGAASAAASGIALGGFAPSGIDAFAAAVADPSIFVGSVIQGANIQAHQLFDATKPWSCAASARLALRL